MTDDNPVSQEAIWGGLLRWHGNRQLKCEQNLTILNKTQRPDTQSVRCWAGKISLGVMGQYRLLPAPTSWGFVRTARNVCTMVCIVVGNESEAITATLVFKDSASFGDGLGILSQPSGGHTEQVCLSPCDVRTPKAFECNYKKITCPAINHHYEIANTYHHHIMTHCITWSECRVERGSFLADLIQVKSVQSIESQWEFCLNKGQDQLLKGIIEQGIFFKDIRSYCHFSQFRDSWGQHLCNIRNI